MKRLRLILISSFAIYLLSITLFGGLPAQANPYSFKPEEPGLYVYHPNSDHVDIIDPVFDVLFYYAMQDNSTQISFFYSLDNQTQVPLNSTLLKSNNIYYYALSKVFNDFTDGEHTFTVYAHCSNGTINPIINTTIKADITAYLPVITSPLNQTTYNTKNLPLTYAIDKEILWSYYSIDGKNNSDLKNFEGNITLQNLSEGQHKLTLAVTTNTSTIHQTIQTIIFSIDTTHPSSTIPEFPIAISLATILAITSVLLIMKKEKQPRNCS